MAQTREPGRRPKRGLLLGRTVPQFIQCGGLLRYQPYTNPTNGKRVWLVMGVSPDESEEPVFTTTSGEHKHFRSADTMINYHCHMCPDDIGLNIPLPKHH